MQAVIHPLLLMLVSSDQQELAAQVRLLKTENQILRSKLPNQVSLSDRERRLIVKHGRSLGGKIRHVLTIVSYSTFRRWTRNVEEGLSPTGHPTRRSRPEPGGGRPPTDETIRALIVRLRKESGWGYTKTRQALRRLGHKVSRQTVKNVLVESGLAPDPPSTDSASWSEFLKRHAATLWQCDFACKRKWTLRGMVDVYFMVFIHIGTRRIWISPCTPNPTGHWTAQQARNFQTHLADHDLSREILTRDNDGKYTTAFDEVFTSADCRVKRITPASPNLQAHVERVIQTIKHEVLNAFCILSDSHLNFILSQAMTWYNTERCHSARDDLPPVRDGEPQSVDRLPPEEVLCRSRLGGHLKSYELRAA